MRNRFVIDTNVLISALLFKSSVPFRAIALAEKQGIILYSEATLKELERVLNRSKFDKYLSQEERQVFLLKFIGSSQLVNITEKISVCRDEKDNKFLELAVSGNANLILTGDLDLLVLNPFQSIEILTPEQFIDRFAE
ncbi:MAG: putative toxin-antitoxin system toxin component, PIN family [Roseofilum sp. SBFL]|uniref:putative toxin-antitoxin system toxin component, PIN family n=1 Tax=unclassified Roseofilum TaxID=2620099 RepID=UPI001B0CA89E|nr:MULTISPECIES: putative toxin-antitoxin system toxin component, PIN family [unclassified Roseofilum]MBP0011931.1 putative toxin-antitoxin system toxin component, PIN family [Roseofilum sp. SID3]MBP0025621.1 putative toxin-antitoxin system toxin component, PIN family [Roseofilum sp. SID2]MBP0037429.1 putative toxin-antitoxin system toxin component, PIN family [Roseofilum sp. SID1]MBP0044782.1 putative toxin-antitoxin system toxin component, PIN family [Roseofilum sp. SBFL]